MGDIPRINAQRFPAKLALGDERRVFTYPELNARVNRLAHWLQAIGLRRGDLLAIVMANRPEYIEAVFAAAKIGVATVPMDNRWGAVELEATRSRSSNRTPTRASATWPWPATSTTWPGGRAWAWKFRAG
jgi:acyl-CoA synthetase (AMP-forming)/AMP-acid ligase II